jgi:hypothetical protein
MFKFFFFILPGSSFPVPASFSYLLKQIDPDKSQIRRMVQWLKSFMLAIG